MSPNEGSQIQAFIMLEARPGKALQLSRRIAGIEGVLATYPVTGPFDVIVHAEASGISGLAQIVVAKIQALGDVARSVTCIVVPEGEN